MSKNQENKDPKDQVILNLTRQLDALMEQGRWLDRAVDRYRAIEQIVGRAVPNCPEPNRAWDGAIMPHDWDWKQKCRRCGESMHSAILSTSEYKGNSVNHWWAKATAYGGMVRNSGNALRAAGHPIDASGEGGGVEGIRRAIEALTADRDEARRALEELKAHLKNSRQSSDPGPPTLGPHPGAIP